MVITSTLQFKTTNLIRTSNQEQGGGGGDTPAANKTDKPVAFLTRPTKKGLCPGQWFE